MENDTIQKRHYRMLSVTHVVSVMLLTIGSIVIDGVVGNSIFGIVVLSVGALMFTISFINRFDYSISMISSIAGILYFLAGFSILKMATGEKDHDVVENLTGTGLGIFFGVFAVITSIIVVVHIIITLNDTMSDEEFLKSYNHQPNG